VRHELRALHERAAAARTHLDRGRRARDVGGGGGGGAPGAARDERARADARVQADVERGHGLGAVGAARVALRAHVVVRRARAQQHGLGAALARHRVHGARRRQVPGQVGRVPAPRAGTVAAAAVAAASLLSAPAVVVVVVVVVGGGGCQDSVFGLAAARASARLFGA